MGACPRGPARHDLRGNGGGGDGRVNVLMTPHVAGWTEGMLAARAALIAGNLDRLARGEPPANLIVRD